MDYQSLYPYCMTEKQIEAVDKVIECKTVREAAYQLGITERNLQKRLQRIRAEAAKKETDITGKNLKVPEGFGIKRISKYFKDGENTSGWVISEPDKEQMAELIEQAIEALAKDLPRYQPIPSPKPKNKNLINLITLTDTHIGMYARGDNESQHWDLERAANVLWGVYKTLIDGSPEAETCVISLIGDLMHCNGGKPVTPKSGHILDVDGDWNGAVDVAIVTVRRIIDYSLYKHKKVVVSIVRGNHDEDQAVWIRKLLQHVYEDEPRLKILGGDYHFSCYHDGDLMLGWYHGDGKKLESLPLYFATQYPEAWGNSKFREIHTGDKHHHKELDISGVLVKQHPTLIPRDSYAKAHGYMSMRFAERITYNKKAGRCSTGTVSPETIDI
jgi:hypothetical protein